MDLDRLVQQLSDPTFYPEPTTRVDVLQTHISYIFLTDAHAYKVKKPVNFGFLDYTTLEQRRTMCEREVTLNARLCPDTYLGVAEIRDDNGTLSIGGAGETVEVAVKMVRLPEERMLRRVLARGEGEQGIFARIARILADFHARAETSPEIQAMKGLDGVKFNCDENFAQTEKYVGTLVPWKTFEFVKNSTNLFFARRAALFERRAREARVRDGHGDLHLDSICVTDPIRIYDCIEFNERFRYADVAEEVAFLAMDLEFHGYPYFAKAFVNAYHQASGDDELLDLLSFYKCYRAYVRAKINSFQVDDPHIPADRKAAIAALATRYYELAAHFAGQFNPRKLFVTCGLTGSGKSTLARKLGERYTLTVIRSDEVRKELLGIDATDRRWVPFNSGEYAPSMTERTYATMVQRADEQLALGHSVVLDGCFTKRDQRRPALKLAKRLGVPFLLLECRTSEAVIRQRLDKRATRNGSVSDGRWEIYHAQLGEWEPPDDIPPDERIVLDRSKPIEALLTELTVIVPPEWDDHRTPNGTT
ncbi:MAG: AAA family ATPase [Acidobacteria bacterium]|nr:AAA family ATPase [Acidobacteriota bacterium]